jgi:protease-4
MVDDLAQTERPQKRHLFRKVLWLVAGIMGTVILMNLFFPDIDLSTEDRIA